MKMEEQIDQSGVGQSAKIQRQLSEYQKDMREQRDQEVGIKLPTLEQYIENQFVILHEHNLSLRQLCHRPHPDDMAHLYKSIPQYFSTSSSKNYERVLPKRNRGQIASQFMPNLKKVPPGALIYISITEIEGGLFHMIVRDVQGEWLAYFERQKQCKKLQKISRILKCIKKPMLTVIIDRTTQNKADRNVIAKACSQASQFIYILANVRGEQIEIDSSERPCRTMKIQPLNTDITKSGNELMIFSSNLSNILDSPIYHRLIGISNKRQNEDNQALCSIRGAIADKDRDLELECIFINVLRTCQLCTPEKAIFIIQDRLFIKKQQNFKEQELMKNQKLQPSVENQDTESHHPQKITSPQDCLNCLLAHRKHTKSSFRCAGCSTEWKMNIVLCIGCQKDFHDNFLKSKEGKKQFAAKRRQLKRKNKKTSNQPEQAQQGEKDCEKASKMQEEIIKIQNPFQNKLEPIIKSSALKLNSLENEMFQTINKLKRGSKEHKFILEALLAFSMEKGREIQDRFPAQNGFEFTSLVAHVVKEAEKLFPHSVQKLPSLNQPVIKSENMDQQ